jgi:DNA-binding MarR family transcriptional regulator
MMSDQLAIDAAAGRVKARASKTTEPIDLSSLEELIGFNIHILDLLMYQLFYERFPKRSITPGVFSTLRAIKANPGVRQGALADALLIQRSNMTILVNQLMRKGLVKRRRSLGDNRGVVLFLAEPGERALKQVQADMIAHEKVLRTGLTAKEQQTLMALLRKSARFLRAAPRRNGNGRVKPA